MPRAVDLELTLAGVTPRIWRHVRVKAAMSLADLHRVIQALMQWGDYHLYLFDVGGREYTSPSEEEDDEEIPSLERAGDDREISVAVALEKGNGAFQYLYDFGDEWQLSIAQVGTAADSASPYPECLAGERAAPPEDSGGPGAYQELLETWSRGGRRALSRERQARLPRQFDPMAFDVDAANGRLSEEFRGDGRAAAELSPEDQLLADLTLLLLFLGSWVEKDGAHVSWKTMRFEMLDLLGDRGFLVTNTHRKSVVLTDAGVRRAEVLRARVSGLLSGPPR